MRVNPEDVREAWAGRSGEFSPAYYAYRGPDERSEAVRRLLERVVGRHGRVLELGCSSGRHLAHLHDAGFDDLSGVELNGDAFDVLREAYPDLAAAGTFHHAAIEDVLPEFGDDAFDAVYSVETLQHLHPEAAWVFDEVVRVTGDLLVTVENEAPTDRTGDPGEGDRESGVTAVTEVTEGVLLYHRDWKAVFTSRGLVEVAVVRGDRDTVRAFRPGAE
jgi:SAM-dependent methyltransferase